MPFSCNVAHASLLDLCSFNNFFVVVAIIEFWATSHCKHVHALLNFDAGILNTPYNFAIFQRLAKMFSISVMVQSY